MVEKSPPSLRRVLAVAALSGVVTALVPPARIPATVRRSLHVASGVAAGGAITWMLGQRADPVADEQPDNRLPVSARVGIGTVLGTSVAMMSVGGVALDAAMERALVRRGVGRPRLWMGLAGAALVAVMEWSDQRRDARSTV